MTSDGPAGDLPLDAHLHTDLSPDADVPIDVYAALAVEHGIAELAITDHIDFDPRAPAFGVAYDVRERTVREAAERWGDQVAIRFGVEVTYESSREDDIRAHLQRWRYDYVIGSVHVMPGSPYAASRVASFVSGRTLAEIVAPYFDEVAAAARSGLFDTIGHFDYVKRYLAAYVPPERLAAAPELWEPALRAIVDSGAALEVNSSGLRQAARETYPTPAAVARYRELGGRLVTAGSDAHRAAWFAWGLDVAYATAARAGYAALAFRRGGAPVVIPVPGRFAVGVGPNATGTESL